METYEMLEEGAERFWKGQEKAEPLSPFILRLFTYCHLLQKKTKLSTFIAAVYIILSGYQLLGLLLDQTIILATSDIFAKFIRYTRIVPFIINADSSQLYITALIASWTFLLLFTYLVIRSYLLKRPSPTIGYLFHILYWILFIPLTELFFTVFPCSGPHHRLIPELTCFSLWHISLICVTGISFILLIVLSSIGTIINCETNGCFGGPLARYQWQNECLFLLIRLYFCLNISYAPQDIQMIAIFISIMYGIYLGSLLSQGYSYYSPTISNFFTGWVLIYQITVTCVVLAQIAQHMEKDMAGIGLILLVLQVTFFFYGIYWNNRRIRILMSKHTFKTAQELDQYLHYCNNVLIESKYPSLFPRDFFGSILLCHKQKCTASSCPLIQRETEQAAFEAKNAKIVSFVNRYKVKDINQLRKADRQIQYNTDLQREADLKWKKAFLLHVSEIHRQIYNPAYMVQLCSLILGLTKNVHKAYLRLAETDESLLYLSFPIHCKRMELYKEITAQLSSIKKHGIPDYGEVLQFENLLTELKRAIKKNAMLRQTFWGTLSSDKVDMNSIHSIGQEIMTQVTGILKIWEKMKDIYPSQKNALWVYSQFLYYILAEKREAITLQNELDLTVQAHLKRWSVGKHSLFADTAVVVVISGDPQNIGRIVKVSQHLEAVLGYNPEEVQGKSVSVLMPPCLARRHVDFLKKAVEDSNKRNVITQLKKSISVLQQVSIYTFAIDRRSFLVPIYISYQQIYTYNFGVCYIGLLRIEPGANDADYIIADVSGKIEGISHGLGKKLNMTSYMVTEQNVMMQNVCQQMAEADTIGHFKGYMQMTLKFSKSIRGEGTKRTAAPSTSSNRNEEDIVLNLECDANKVTYSNGYELMVFKLTLPDDENEKHISNKALNVGTKKILPMVLKSYPHKASQLPREECLSRKEDFKKDSAENEDSPPANPTTTKLSTLNNLLTNPVLVRMPTKVGKKEDANKAFEIQSYNSVTSKPAQARTVRTIRQLRRQTNEDYSPVFLSRIRLVAIIFYLFICCLLISNIIAIFYNVMRVKSDASIIQYNTKRQLAFGYAARAIQQLAAIENGQIPFRPRFNYTSIDLSSNDIITYKEYVMNNFKLAITYAEKGQQAISAFVDTLNIEDRSEIDPISFILYNPISKVAPISVESAVVAVSSFVTHALKVSALGTTKAQYSTTFLLNNTLGTYLVGFDKTPAALIKLLHKRLELQTTLTLAFLMVVAGLSAAFMLIIVPVVSQATKEMDKTLRYLLVISSNDIKVQLKRIKHFMTTVSQARTKYDDEEVDGGYNDAESMADDNLLVDSKAAKEEVEQKLNRKKVRVRSKKHVSYHGGKLKIVILIAVAIGLFIGLYVGLNWYSNHYKYLYISQTEELNTLAFIANTNTLLLAYAYRYIISAKSGYCGEYLCDYSIKSLVTLQNNAMTNLLIFHKKNQGDYVGPYASDFYSLVEANACETLLLKPRLECKSLLGGVVREGLAASVYLFSNMISSVYEDFKLTDKADVVEFLNDDRLLGLEIMHDNLLHPTIMHLLQSNMRSLEESVQEHALELVEYVLGFIIYLLIGGVWGIRVLLRSLRNMSFNTKSMLAALPTDVIMNNKEIFLYLSESSRTIELQLIRQCMHLIYVNLYRLFNQKSCTQPTSQLNIKFVNMSMLIILLLLLLKSSISTVQINNISTVYIKGEEKHALYLDEYFKGDSVSYNVSGTNKYVNFYQGITELQTLTFISLHGLQYNSSLLFRTQPNTHVFVVEYKNRYFQEFMLTYSPSTGFSLTSLKPELAFESKDHCLLYSNEKERGNPEVIIRCRNRTGKPIYDTYSKKLGPESYVKWNEDTIKEEDLKNPLMQFSQDVSAVLSEDRMEEKLYSYLTDKKEKVYVNTEIFSLRDYTSKHTYTDFVLHRPYSFLLSDTKYLCIYLQRDYIGISSLLSNFTLPFTVDTLIYDPKHEPDALYAYTNGRCDIVRINIRDKFWPHVDFIYSLHASKEFHQTTLVISKSFVICAGLSSHTSLYIFNKSPGPGQALAGSYNVSIQKMHTLYYENDTFLQVHGRNLDIIKIYPRILVISTIHNPMGKITHLPIEVTAEDTCGETIKTSFKVHLLPPFVETCYENKEKEKQFNLLAGESFVTDINEYVLGANESYVGVEGNEKMMIEITDKLQQIIHYANWKGRVQSVGSKNSCILWKEFEVKIGKTKKLVVKGNRFELAYCKEDEICIVQRVITLENESYTHCVINNEDKRLHKGGSYHLYLDRYFIFISQANDGVKYLNVLDLDKPNINNYYSIAKLEGSETLDINSYYLYFEDSSTPPTITITSSEEPRTYYQFALNVRGYLIAITPHSSKEVEKYSVAIVHISGKRIPLEFSAYSYNLGVDLSQTSTKIVHEYKNDTDTAVIDMGRFVQGYNVSLLPIIDGNYSYDYSKIKIHQQITYIKGIESSGHGWDLLCASSSPSYPLVTLSVNEYNMLNVSFYNRLSTSPFDKDKPLFKVLTDTQLYKVLSIGPTLTLENTIVLSLYTYDMVGNDGYSLKFISLQHRSILPPAMPFSFPLKKIAYNPNTHHLFLLEEISEEGYSNKLFVKSTIYFDLQRNNFDYILGPESASLSSWSVTAIEVCATQNELFLGVKDFGIITFIEQTNGIELYRKVNLTEYLSFSHFSINSIHFIETTNATYLFGITDNEVFTLYLGPRVISFVDSYLKPPIFSMAGISAIQGSLLAVAMKKGCEFTASEYTVIFYNFNENSQKIEMKSVLNTGDAEPFFVHFIEKSVKMSHMLIGTQRRIEMYKVMLDPEIVLSPELGVKKVEIECQNAVDTKFFAINYIPIKVGKNTSRVFVIVIAALASVVVIGILLVWILRRIRKKNKDKENEAAKNHSNKLF
eukprot:TRINITY_DN135176_c0_g1_i1.p1 TRINITY_DN135176_c0_g1~~TRINITY_DN135176_c0_g1_i1.p1  ORF type:complete len:2870 (+),score=189.85 TRINITY_DN135176_c0_g1_i1:98-8707(+)